MATVRHELRGATIAGATALALAVAAALLLGVSSAVRMQPGGSDTAVTLTFLLGGVLWVWAAIVGVVVIGHAVREGLARRRPAAGVIALTSAAVFVMIAIAVAAPIVGSGGGVG